MGHQSGRHPDPTDQVSDFGLESEADPTPGVTLESRGQDFFGHTRVGDRIGVNQNEQRNVFPYDSQLMRHLQRHESTKAITSQPIRPVGLDYTDGANVVCCHRLDRRKGITPAVQATSLERKEWAFRF